MRAKLRNSLELIFSISASKLAQQKQREKLYKHNTYIGNDIIICAVCVPLRILIVFSNRNIIQMVSYIVLPFCHIHCTLLRRGRFKVENEPNAMHMDGCFIFWKTHNYYPNFGEAKNYNTINNSLSKIINTKRFSPFAVSKIVSLKIIALKKLSTVSICVRI